MVTVRGISRRERGESSRGSLRPQRAPREKKEGIHGPANEKNLRPAELPAAGLGVSEPGEYRISLEVDDGALTTSTIVELQVQGGFTRGDANSDGGTDIGDAIFVLSDLFAHAAAPSCMDAADANDSGMVDIADAIAVLGHLSAYAGPLPRPFDECGADDTTDDLDCGSFPPCEG